MQGACTAEPGSCSGGRGAGSLQAESHAARGECQLWGKGRKNQEKLTCIGSRAQPAPQLRGAGNAQDFSAGMMLQGWGLESKTIIGLERQLGEEVKKHLIQW